MSINAAVEKRQKVRSLYKMTEKQTVDKDNMHVEQC